MAQQKQAFCKQCGKPTLHQKADPPKQNAMMHVLLTIVTCGIWLPVALLFYGIQVWGELLAPWHCQACGSRLVQMEKAG